MLFSNPSLSETQIVTYVHAIDYNDLEDEADRDS
jgi:hypothetical protein